MRHLKQYSAAMWEEETQEIIPLRESEYGDRGMLMGDFTHGLFMHAGRR